MCRNVSALIGARLAIKSCKRQQAWVGLSGTETSLIYIYIYACVCVCVYICVCECVCARVCVCVCVCRDTENCWRTRNKSPQVFAAMKLIPGVAGVTGARAAATLLFLLHVFIQYYTVDLLVQVITSPAISKCRCQLRTSTWSSKRAARVLYDVGLQLLIVLLFGPDAESETNQNVQCCNKTKHLPLLSRSFI